MMVLLMAAGSLPGLWASRSDAPRGVASPFVFDVKATCAPPCQHSGICIRNDTCFCMRGYEGESCQYVTCEGGCWNGGDCVALNGVATCLCLSSWTGSRCQDAVCPQGCRNGGSCVAPGICSCPDGWVGGACHTAVCSQPCLSGGKCISPEKCRCRPPYEGPRCERRRPLDFSLQKVKGR
ncbi:hypothetical protein CRUP_006451 [Coryphaenoides rupestris]|nr:hypothetical protein CRUP_006451 [Coryphaenoides rupestris]